MVDEKKKFDVERYLSSITDIDKDMYLKIRSALVSEIDREPTTSDLLMIDVIVNNFISIKRCHRWLSDNKDIEFDKNGRPVVSNVAIHLLRLERNFKDLMRESMFTRKSSVLKGLENSDASTWLSNKIIDVDNHDKSTG